MYVYLFADTHDAMLRSNEAAETNHVISMMQNKTSEGDVMTDAKLRPGEVHT